LNASSQNLLLINDVHLNVNATANTLPLPGDETTPLLLDIILQEALDENNALGTKLDGILAIGDFVRHYLAAEYG
jgi:hypothetical protein